ncbi:hypothetical protein A5785_11415 [Gordonia sp. 852002-50395_SCH5434458]|uniref:Uncharacterized protein n=1 Tax=Gordonia sputi NBRC 100414 TaxID=1089453 RepID=H5U0X5_9ACTN|nr:hypothetical protein A5785_11415 [Gordonia sp. 852002-50395_SCH5434458]GAB39383.1 hypothetical protein GOSPT_064_00210 [Gordonia sputi NBRC 100414]
MLVGTGDCDSPRLVSHFSPLSRLQFIHRHGEARHADVCRALGIPETDNAHHLAAIRSGTWPAKVTLPNTPTA